MRRLEKRIYLSPPHMSGEEIKKLEEAIASNWIAPLGPQVQAFEREMANFLGMRDAVALQSGTAGIHLALLASGVSSKDTVFCSTLTFVASANPILYLGAFPVFIDSEPGSWNMSPLALERAFRDAKRRNILPKAVVVTNLYGQSADLGIIGQLCAHYGVPLIEDAAESLGATYQGKASGTVGDFGVYSFNGNKIITTSGGGMVVSKNVEAIEKIRFWATQARDPAPYYQHSEVGYNYRLSNLLAAVGRAQLKVLPERIHERRMIYRRYGQELQGIDGIAFMPEAAYGTSTRWLTTAMVDEEKTGISAAGLVSAFEELNIETRRVWKPLHLQPLYHGYDYYPHTETDSFSEKVFFQGICLPSGSNLLESEQNLIISLLKQWIGG